MILVTAKRSQKESQLICKGFSGTLWYPESGQDLQMFNHTYESIADRNFLDKQCGVDIWIGLQKVDNNDGNQVENLSGSKVSYVKWGPGQPNGRNKALCVSIEKKAGIFTALQF